MMLPPEEIEKILVESGYVSQADIDAAHVFASSHHVSTLDYLYGQELLSRDILGQALAEKYSIPYGDLHSHVPPKEQVLQIPEAAARDARVVLLRSDDTTVTIATDTPDETKTTAALAAVFAGKKISLVYSLPEDIDTCLLYYRQPLADRYKTIFEDNNHTATELLHQTLLEALDTNASDVHFDVHNVETVVRFRVDGVLHEVGRIPSRFYESMLNLIKIESNLRIDEHSTTQDGSIRYDPKNGTAPVDLRVSIVPTVAGEKIVLRVLSHYAESLMLTDLGIPEAGESLIVETAKKPFGMIVVTGPTGSGKSTSLYALLKHLNTTEVNIATIEDPVEYKLEDANQIQVNPRSNVTFASGLRSIVRQDPDVILVGEIRDEETADIAINAALVGHLLLSTFHANDAASAIPRLLDMGVEPYLLASSLELLVAQRLVRKICEACRYSVPAKKADIEAISPAAVPYFGKKEIRLYRGKGCPVCHGMGYRGRIGIFELLPVTHEIRDKMLSHPTSEEIWALAKGEPGTLRLFEDAIDKVKKGLTTLEEVARVIPVPKE